MPNSLCLLDCSTFAGLSYHPRQLRPPTESSSEKYNTKHLQTEKHSGLAGKYQCWELPVVNTGISRPVLGTNIQHVVLHAHQNDQIKFYCLQLFNF
uniref:Uncharacterized protein n=1 Tax=Magallana gigas TaxID=29159 RepID=K1QR36_MAGGI